MSEEAASGGVFNLLDEAWIPVLWQDGRWGRVGIRQALADAGSIRQIAASNPMDLFAIHRFLLTLLCWKAESVGGAERLRETLLQGTVPRAMIDALEAEACRFRLFDAEQPFLQDVTVGKQTPKSAGSLFAEFACGTNIAFFHHGHDDGMRLCLPCAAMGLLRLVPWTQFGGKGHSAAVHNAPPIMALACGPNLAVTLGLNCVPLAGKAGEAKWSGEFSPSNPNAPIPYMEALTWNPRRVHLPDPEPEGRCWCCGHDGVPVVGPIVYAKNDNTKMNKEGGKAIPFQWQDPAAFYFRETRYRTVKSSDEKRAAVGCDLDRLAGDDPPVSLVGQENPDHNSWLLLVPCTNKAKSYDHRQLRTAGVDPGAIRSLLPPDVPLARQAGVDGWTDPGGEPRQGAIAFVRAATRLLTHVDWATLAAAAFRPMHFLPAAFDLLSGLHWSLRGKFSGLPSRNVAWLVLKLMAAVPAAARVPADGGVCPLGSLRKRQIDERRGERSTRSPYPLSLPRGHRLEAALRGALEDYSRRCPNPVIDWAGLCHRLDQLLK